MLSHRFYRSGVWHILAGFLLRGSQGWKIYMLAWLGSQLKLNILMKPIQIVGRIYSLAVVGQKFHFDCLLLVEGHSQLQETAHSSLTQDFLYRPSHNLAVLFLFVCLFLFPKPAGEFLSCLKRLWFRKEASPFEGLIWLDLVHLDNLSFE